MATKTRTPRRFEADDRTDAQLATHHHAVIATDRCMSGWGGARGRSSVAGWAFQSSALADGRSVEVEKWVSARSEMRRVRIVDLRTYRPRNAHVHIYVASSTQFGRAFAATSTDGGAS
jgi:hypothetical protein